MRKGNGIKWMCDLDFPPSWFWHKKNLKTIVKKKRKQRNFSLFANKNLLLKEKIFRNENDGGEWWGSMRNKNESCINFFDT